MPLLWVLYGLQLLMTSTSIDCLHLASKENRFVFLSPNSVKHLNLKSPSPVFLEWQSLINPINTGD